MESILERLPAGAEIEALVSERGKAEKEVLRLVKPVARRNLNFENENGEYVAVGTGLLGYELAQRLRTLNEWRVFMGIVAALAFETRAAQITGKMIGDCVGLDKSDVYKALKRLRTPWKNPETGAEREELIRPSRHGWIVNPRYLVMGRDHRAARGKWDRTGKALDDEAMKKEYAETQTRLDGDPVD